MTMSDEEIRYAAIKLLTRPTERDKQRRIGASDLSDGCDRCLAHKLLGHTRESIRSKHTWMGAVLGTAFHAVLENRINEGNLPAVGLPASTRPENHVTIGEIIGYGLFGGTIDVDIIDEDQTIDWKGSTRKKLCILIDFMAMEQGLTAPFGRLNKWVAGPGRGRMPESEYDAEMAKMKYKFTGYYGQQTLYMHGAKHKRASVVFLTRDGTGYFDVPEGARYTDPTAVHDVHVISFNYDEAYALALISRGQAIWDRLQAGEKPDDFVSNEFCYICGNEQPEAPVVIPLEAAA